MNSIRNVELKDVNVVIVDMDMLDVPGRQGPEQKDIEMVDIFEEVFILNELDPVPSSPSPK